MRLPDGRVANLVAAVALPALAFTAIAFVSHVVRDWPDLTPIAGVRTAAAFKESGVAIFGLVLIAGFGFLWRALRGWALLAAIVYFPALIYMVVWIGVTVSTFLGRADS